MPTSDLDMPLLPSAEQIRRREFATVRRGYDPQQVRAYLTSIANAGRDAGTRAQPAAPGGRFGRRTTGRCADGDASVDACAGAVRDRRRLRRPVEALRHADRDGGSGSRADPRERADRSRSSRSTRRGPRPTGSGSTPRRTPRRPGRRGRTCWSGPETESDRVLAGLAERRRELVDAAGGDALQAPHRRRGPGGARSKRPREPRRRTPISSSPIAGAGADDDAKAARRRRGRDTRGPALRGPLGAQGPLDRSSPISRRSTWSSTSARSSGPGRRDGAWENRRRHGRRRPPEGDRGPLRAGPGRDVHARSGDRSRPDAHARPAVRRARADRPALPRAPAGVGGRRGGT